MGTPFRKIGLTGGVASGKSTVAELLRAAGIPVLNLDEIGRELTGNDLDLQRSLGAILGPGVFEGGVFDRTKAREILFSDSEKRRSVEKVLHPRIQAEFEKRARAERTQGHKLVICEAALLMEAGIDKELDGLILVTAPEAVRTTRVVERDRIGAVLAKKMIRSQLKDADRRSTSQTVLIANQGSVADLSLKVSELVSKWKASGWL